MQYFNIQVASQLSGVASATIRAWEKRYNAVVPERAENKHRLYSETDIEKLALLYRLTEFGQSIGKIAHLDLAELKNVYSTLLHRPYDEKELVTPNHERIDAEKIMRNIFLALSAFKTDIMTHELEKARLILSPIEYCQQIIAPLMSEMKKNLREENISKSQANALHSIIMFEVGLLINQHYQKAIHKEGLILIATDDEDEGLMACCTLMCIHYGIRFVYLAKNLDAKDLALAAQSLRAKSILLNLNQSNSLENLRLLKQELNGNTELYLFGDVGNDLKPEIEKKHVLHLPHLEALEKYLESF